MSGKRVGQIPWHEAPRVPSRWRRRGLVFPREGVDTPSWMQGYAALPYPLDSGDSRIRVFFSGRDEQNRASVGALTLDLGTMRVLPGSVTRDPLLSPGSLGAFDDSGTTVACVVPHDGKLHLYYTGWMLGRTVPFYFAIGLAVSSDGGATFARHSAAPILDRHPKDPYLCASPTVLVEEDIWRMWYVSGQQWERRPEGPRHYYLIRYAESEDGIHWRREKEIDFEFTGPGEYAIGRPHVLRVGSEYHMWYCARGDRYRLGWARSPDGFHWTRDDGALSLESAPSVWDYEMQAYPSVLYRDGRWWMFYNGNGYGATGFGLAEGMKEPTGGDQ